MWFVLVNFHDRVIRCLVFQGFQVALEIIGEQEGHDVNFELFSRVVGIAFDRVALDCSVEHLNLSLRPRMPEST